MAARRAPLAAHSQLPSAMMSTDRAVSCRSTQGGYAERCVKRWCRGAESNCLRRPFQGRALPVSYPGTGEVVILRTESRDCQTGGFRVESSLATIESRESPARSPLDG